MLGSESLLGRKAAANLSYRLKTINRRSVNFLNLTF